MEKIREKIESWFETLTHLIYRHRFKTLTLVLAVVAGFVTYLPQITIDTSLEGFLHEDDPSIIDYNAFRDQFGRDEMIVIAVNPPDVFDSGFLEKLKEFHDDLEENVPYLDDINSLINARNTRGEGDELIVEDLLENFPRNDAEMEELKNRVLSHPLYRNLLISEDGKFTTIVLKTNSYSSIGEETDFLAGFEDEGEPQAGEEKRTYFTTEENREVVNAVKKLIAEYNSDDFPLYLAGSPVIIVELQKAMMADMQRFMKMALAIIAIVLFILFRRISGVLMPFLVVIFSLLSTLGLMAITGTPIKMPTQILPSFLLAVGVGASVHLLTLFYRRYDQEGDKEAAIVYAMGHSGLPIVMTSLTTAVGLGSFATAIVAPIADLGKFASFGVMLALFNTIIMIPALISIFPLRRKESSVGGREPESMMDKFLTCTANFSTGYPKSIIAVSAVILIVGLAFASQLKFTHNPLTWLPESMNIRKATTKIDHELKGSITLEVIIDTEIENGFYDPSLLNRIDELKNSIETYNEGELFVGKTIAITDILKEINKALNENRSEFYTIPQNPQLIAQEFLLFENSGSDDLEDIVDSQFSKARVTIKMPWIDVVAYGKFIQQVEEEFKSVIGDDAKVTVTGLVSLLGRTLNAAIYSMGQSYFIAFGMITIMMVLLIGELRIGLASMIPNLTPIIVTLGIMKAAGFPLDMFTMLVGSIAIGLAVDDTVHFMHNFKKYYYDGRDAREAVRNTFHTAGRAMLTTTIVLSLGFFIFMFSPMSNIFNFGLLTGITIIMALLADFLLAPALVKVITDYEKSKAGKS